MATPTTPKTGGKTGKPTKTAKAKPKAKAVKKPAHPGSGKAKSSNEPRVMKQPAPKAVTGSDGRKHTFGRFTLGITQK